MFDLQIAAAHYISFNAVWSPNCAFRIIVFAAGESEETKASATDDSATLHSKPRASREFSRKITCTCVLLMVERLGLHLHAAFVQTMVVAHKNVGNTRHRKSESR